MSHRSRDDRLVADLETVRALKKGSELFDFECNGESPDRYTFIFHGKGISRDTSPHASIETVDLHRCNVRLPYSYPERPPDIRWLTPIFHPNVSFSGFINLKDIGIRWEPQLTLDDICERLWDVARLEYLDLANATNYSAKTWFEDRPDFATPVDERPLRDRPVPAGSNVVKYERRGTSVALPVASENKDVYFIGEDTPVPDLPRGQGRRSSGTDDDVIYIGYD